MSHVVKILAVDPALRNLGFAHLVLPADGGKLDLRNLRLVQTENGAGKTVRKNSDDLRRASEAWEVMCQEAEWADIIAAEIPSGTQSARGAMSNGITLGLLAALGRIRPLIQVSAAEAKRVATGRRTASKDEMIAWATGLYPQAPWLTRKLKGEVRMLDANEHLADAVAIGIAATHTVEFRAALSMLRVGGASGSGNHL
jgi:Holliday junction resolvasome RuvABC endonuclease subunit